MRFVGLSLVSAMCLLAANTASAEGVALTDRQLDQVTAGALELKLAPLTMGTVSAGSSLINSPLAYEAAVRVVWALDDAYQQQNQGQSIVSDPFLGEAILGLFLWGANGLQ